MAGLFVGVLPDILSPLILSNRLRPAPDLTKEVRRSIDPAVIVGGSIPLANLNTHAHIQALTTGVTAARWKGNE